MPTEEQLAQLDRLLVAAPRMQLYAEIRKTGGVVQRRVSGSANAFADFQWQNSEVPSFEWFVEWEIRRKPEPERLWLVFNQDGKCLAVCQTPESADAQVSPPYTVREFVEVVK